MARLYVPGNLWTKLPYIVGSVQNLSEKYNLLISEGQSENDFGQELLPMQEMNFNTQLYVRSSKSNKDVQISVNPFQDTVGSSGSSGGIADLSNYVTRSEVQGMISTATKDVVYDMPSTFCTTAMIDALFK